MSLANFKGHIEVYFILSTVATSCKCLAIVHSHANFLVAHYSPGNSENLRTREYYVSRNAGYTCSRITSGPIPG